jgi:plastocyanin
MPCRISRGEAGQMRHMMRLLVGGLLTTGLFAVQ